MKLPDSKPLIVLEAGATHGGYPAVALKLLEAGKEADAVKFQTVWGANLAPYRQGRLTYRDSKGEHSSSIVEMLQAREMGWEVWSMIDRHAEMEGIPWFSTPDMPATAKALGLMDVCGIKIAGRDMGRTDLILAAANTGQRMLLDTRGEPGELDTALAFCREFREDTIIVHTPTGYPTNDPGMARIGELIEQYPGHIIGYTSHSMGIQDCIQAAHMGAGYIEKGISLDRQTPGIEHLMCIEPEEVGEFVQEVRDAYLEGFVMSHGGLG